MSKSALYRIGTSDVAKGLLVAVLAAVFTQVAGMLNAPGFQLAQFDWGLIFKVATASAVGYISKQFFTDSSGTLLGSADDR